MQPQLKVVESRLGVVEIHDELRPIVPDGVYRLGYVEHVTGIYFKQPKVCFRFRILDYGQHNGVVLERFYNVARIIGKPQKFGGFKPARNGHFLNEFVTCFDAHISRLDRLPLSLFERHILKGVVRTTDKDSTQRKRPKALRYSVIEQLIGVDDDFTP